MKSITRNIKKKAISGQNGSVISKLVYVGIILLVFSLLILLNVVVKYLFAFFDYCFVSIIITYIIALRFIN